MIPQKIFANLAYSLAKVTVMFIGEVEYKDIFVDTLNENDSDGRPYNPFPEAAFVFCVLFVFIMAIVLANLLVRWFCCQICFSLFFVSNLY